jgi:hypothetical protein
LKGFVSADRFVLVAATLAAAIVVAVTGAGAGSPVDVRTELPAVDSVTVGERIRIVHRFLYPDSLTMRVPGEIDPGTCRLLSVDWSEEKQDGTTEKTAELSLITLDLEAARLPAIAAGFVTPSGDTLIAFAEEIVIPVRSLAAGADGPKPLKEQWIAPADYTKWLLAGLALLVAVAALVWWIRRRARRQEQTPPEPKLPADYIALTELTRIEKMNLLDAGRFKQYYTLITDVVRRYLEARYTIDAMDRTTSELLSELEARRRRVEKLEDLLNEADLVKFARLIPGIEAGHNAISMAREIIVKTKPAPVVPGAGAAETDGGAPVEQAGGNG